MGSGFEPLAPHQAKRHLLILFRGTSASFHEQPSALLAGETIDNAK